jgi:quinoprotein glucose dehydrogenase
MLKLNRPLDLRVALLVWVLAPFTARAQHELSQASQVKPFVAPASKDGELAIKNFQVAPGLKVDLWAAEPMLANPVAFNFDEKGRAYVCETFRLGAGVDDIRGIMDWLDEELAARTVDDRLAEMKRHLGDRFPKYSEHSERIRRIEDRDGDGKADHSTVFAEDFNTPLDGIGAGVLARNGTVWYANIPNLWQLRDTNNDGVADSRKSLHYGFGVRVGFLGHDLHGVHFGPDGRIYFSIGDRGSNIKVADGRMVGEPDTGCVFRCNPDGSELEVFSFGLRNPQDLVFDQYGNLFTGDNNSDSGDEARWVYVVEGGDNGWRVGYQFMENPYSRGPFNEEKLWHPHFEGQAAYIVPPIANIASGPSGVAYFPGTGLPARYQDHFFLVDFRGGPVNSGVHTFTLKPKGASFELVAPEHFLWGILATDVKFGPAGGIYVSDWVEGWGMTGKGRLYRAHDPALDGDPLVLETKRLLSEGMGKRSFKELAGLLAHRDQRVRQEAQFALAERGKAGLPTLAGVARKNANQLARLHAIWGIGQSLRVHGLLSPALSSLGGGEGEANAVLELLARLLGDGDAEVRAQCAKLLGECRWSNAYDGLIGLLKDSSPRVRFFAAMSLAKLGRRQAVPALVEMLRENADKDPYLRHAGVMGLTGIGDLDAVLGATKDESPAVRMGALLALRRMQRPEITTSQLTAAPRNWPRWRRGSRPMTGGVKPRCYAACSTPTFTWAPRKGRKRWRLLRDARRRRTPCESKPSKSLATGCIPRAEIGSWDFGVRWLRSVRGKWRSRPCRLPSRTFCGRRPAKSAPRPSMPQAGWRSRKLPQFCSDWSATQNLRRASAWQR